jgi:hypothetical protein
MTIKIIYITILCILSSNLTKEESNKKIEEIENIEIASTKDSFVEKVKKKLSPFALFFQDNKSYFLKIILGSSFYHLFVSNMPLDYSPLLIIPSVLITNGFVNNYCLEEKDKNNKNTMSLWKKIFLGAITIYHMNNSLQCFKNSLQVIFDIRK